MPRDQKGRRRPFRRSSLQIPTLIQYAVARSGHQGIWVYPKAMIKPPGADGTPGLIPDYLIATRSSLGYFWHVVELKRFDVQFANSDGSGLSSEGHKAIAQCQAYLTHFQDYIETVRNNVRIPKLIQPSPYFSYRRKFSLRGEAVAG